MTFSEYAKQSWQLQYDFEMLYNKYDNWNCFKRKRELYLSKFKYKEL